MKKTNKILRIVVSVLLCLTLISSCILSSIFAKYTTERERGFTAVIEKFGVTVEVSTPISSLSAEQKKQLGLENVTVTNNAGSNDAKSGIYTITISNLPIRPGVGTTPNNKDVAPDIYSSLVKFTFSGTANVHVRISMATDITYNNIDWTVPGEVLGSGKSDTKYLPIGFNLYTYNGNTRTASYSLGDPWRTEAQLNDKPRPENIASNLGKYINVTQYTKPRYEGDDQYAKYVYKDFTPTTPVVFATKKDNDKTSNYNESSKTVTSIVQGIYWPLNAKDAPGVEVSSSLTEALQDKIDTWFTETYAYVENSENNPSITLTYTVIAEQIPPPST